MKLWPAKQTQSRRGTWSAGKHRRAIADSIFLIHLMRELVQHDVTLVVDVGGARPHVRSLGLSARRRDAGVASWIRLVTERVEHRFRLAEG